jgi:hypothetical protein
MTASVPRPIKFTELIVCPPYGFRLDGNWESSRSWMHWGIFYPSALTRLTHPTGLSVTFLRARA